MKHLQSKDKVRRTRVLWAINNGHETQEAIAKATGYNHAVVGRVLEDLITSGYITRVSESRPV